MLDTLFFTHLVVQAGRMSAAAFLLAVLFAVGARALKIARVTIDDPLERLVLNVATGFAIHQFVVRLLGELPVLSRTGTWLIVFALAAAAVTDGPRNLREQLRGIRVSLDWGTAAILALLVAPLSMALAPSVSKDAMIYHLRFPEMTLAQGRWAYDLATSTSYYPAATQTLYLPMLAIDRQGVAAQLIHFGFFILTMLAAAAIARRLGAARVTGTMILFAAIPAAAIVAGWAWADLPLLFALASSVVATLCGLPALAMLFLGLAASVKYSALLAGLPILVLVFVQASRRSAWRALAIGTLLGVLVMAPWYVTNAVRTGNPVYPLASGVFGTEQQGTEAIAAWSRTAQQSWFDIWSGYFTHPQTLDEDVGGILFLVIAIAAFAMALRERELRAAALVVAAMWMVFLPLTTAMRLLLPAVAATMVLAGIVAARTRHQKLASAMIVLFAVRGGLVTAAHNAYFLNPLPAAAGIETEAAYVRRNFAPQPLYERAASLPSNARVLAVNEVRLFRFPRQASAARVYDSPILARYTSGATSRDQVLARLRSDGVTHLLVGLQPVERGPRPSLGRDGDRLVTELIRSCRVADREGSTILFELPPSVR